ncbi:hypothetical protein Kpol_499p24 [Vanderwaltozyma polyspora DSM 70294]|uniref:RRM domain-containing protein n=1 Tax=Vanderwaltozyma polyspora (strain ATCC 22028 / DSM 70294 / BCRC 21397 / CBS 2163 / NBRC 10782 / NRRL Y-8283 / UCD 57-17) TaxID=436907 RepID=A7TP27_VANPO|nr:uncharacterized protein Kpol_499p24 [Vanderwaltozyma polyspora DSM 70294]EDO15996.1 hypothetical protein Kpol_499p24 [Vanderwaltozyma polyspora DSM 70294]
MSHQNIAIDQNNNSSKRKDSDQKSIFVSNISLEITPEVIDELFRNCGDIQRITILYDKNTHSNKGGHAYVEFDSVRSKENALELNGIIHEGRKLIIRPKRTNIPRFQRVNSKYLTDELQ